MGKLIGKGSSLLLQIIFVAALVLVFCWFDPFKILVPTKKTLKNTPIQIQSIREIGQLITAEYYGEVISSLKEVVDEEDFNQMQEFNYVTDDLHRDFRIAIQEFVEDTLSKSKKKDIIFKDFVEAYPEFDTNSLYSTYLYYIYEKIKDRNYKRNESTKKLNKNKQKRLIKRLYLNRFGWRDKLMHIETDEFKKTRKEIIDKASKKQYRKSRLVLIGRGWIKTGFDFGSFTQRNFRYNKSRNRIHFIGMQPKILSKTINPWFIPEEGVEGFEFLIAERGARLEAKYTMKVKQRCLDKLEQQAMTKKILELAKKNAENNLRSFFSILLDKEIDGVYFHANMLNYTMNVITCDSTVISNEEIITIGA